MKHTNMSRNESPIEIFYREDTVLFSPSVFGPNNYSNLKTGVKLDNLKIPTIAEINALVYSALGCDDNISETVKKYSKRIQTIINEERILGFTKLRYSLNSGGVFILDEIACRGLGNLSQKRLEEELSSREERGVFYSEDRSLRFVPFGFKTGHQAPGSLAKNPYIIALVGEEEAEKLSKITRMYKDNPYIENFTPSKEFALKVPVLYADCSDSSSPSFVIDCIDYDRDKAFTFGVVKRTL